MKKEFESIIGPIKKIFSGGATAGVEAPERSGGKPSSQAPSASSSDSTSLSTLAQTASVATSSQTADDDFKKILDEVRSSRVENGTAQQANGSSNGKGNSLPSPDFSDIARQDFLSSVPPVHGSLTIQGTKIA